MFGFGKKKMQKLESEEDVTDETPMRIITFEKQPGNNPGLTVGNTPDGTGVVVVSLIQGGLAQLSGVVAGDIILTVNEHSVGTHSECVALIDSAAHGKVTPACPDAWHLRTYPEHLDPFFLVHQLVVLMLICSCRHRLQVTLGLAASKMDEDSITRVPMAQRSSSRNVLAQ
jgi:hypothetical protein